MAKKTAETPLMTQYNALKAEYPEALLLFRVGDFYETFGDDAVAAAKALDIVLTKRSNGAAADMPLAGFPHHSLDAYMPRLVKAGFKVAICEQLEDPKSVKGIVKRGVTEVVTPGIAHHETLLSARSNRASGRNRPLDSILQAQRSGVQPPCRPRRPARPHGVRGAERT